MKIDLRKKLYLFTFVILAGNCILGYAIYQGNRKLLNSEQWVNHTEQVINQSDNIVSIANNIAFTSSILTLTSDSTFLKPIAIDQKIVIDKIGLLKIMTTDNPVQQHRVDSLGLSFQKLVDFSKKSVKTQFKKGMDKAEMIGISQNIKFYIDNIKKITTNIDLAEKGLLKERKQVIEHSLYMLRVFAITMFFIMIGLVGLLVATSRRYLDEGKEREKRAAELVIANRELLFQSTEKAKRAAELIVANTELLYQNNEKEKRSTELALANTELSFQNKEKEKRAAELVIANTELLFQNEERRNRATELNKANRLYAVNSQINQNILRVKNEKILFNNACRIAIEFGKFKVAWIGLFDEGGLFINLVDQLGIPANYLKYYNKVVLASDDPQALVFQTGVHYICNDILCNDPLHGWRKIEGQEGIGSCIILPIKQSHLVIGTFNLYAEELDFFNEDEVLLLTAMAADISFALNLFEMNNKHKLTQELVARNEERFRTLIEKSTDMIALSTIDGKMNYVGNSITAGLGYTVDELLYTSVFDIIHPDEIATEIENRDLILAIPGSSFYFQQRRKHKNGDWVWCEGTLTNLLHEPGIYALVSNFRDISEKKKAENQREFDQNNLNALINSTSDLMWSIDRNFKLITFNQPFYNVVKAGSGTRFEMGDDIFSVPLSSGQYKRFRSFYARVFAGESFVENEHTFNPVESSSEISYSPIYRGKEIIGAACHSHDITERIRAEKNLTQSEFRLKEAQAIAHVGNFEVNVDDFSEQWSDEMFKIYGIRKKFATPSKKLFLSFIHPDDVDEVCLAMDESSTAEFRFLKADGSLRYGYSETRVELDASGRLIRTFGILQDITEIKLAESERTKMLSDLMQRNKDLEQFAYIISHNLRAPIANIIGASTALNDAGLDEADKEIFSRGITQSVLKLDGVVKDLNYILEVKNNNGEIKEVVYFSTLISDIRLSINNLIINNQITIAEDFSATDHLVTLKAYLYSIFYNLIINSVKYRRKNINTLIEISSRIEKGKLQLIFKDNGSGIDLKKWDDQVFGMYKRFHPNIEGKGMGLFMVKTQVEALGGKITVKSTPGEGAQFTIEFEL